MLRNTNDAKILKMSPASMTINTLIHRQWPELTEEEINRHRTDLEGFFEAIKQKYNLSQDEVDINLNRITHEVLYAAA